MIEPEDPPLITCAECSDQVAEDEAEREGWRYWSDGVELYPYCPDCAGREFKPR